MLFVCWAWTEPSLHACTCLSRMMHLLSLCCSHTSGSVPRRSVTSACTWPSSRPLSFPLYPKLHRAPTTLILERRKELHTVPTHKKHHWKPVRASRIIFISSPLFSLTCINISCSLVLSLKLHVCPCCETRCQWGVIFQPEPCVCQGPNHCWHRIQDRIHCRAEASGTHAHHEGIDMPPNWHFLPLLTCQS